MTVIVPVFNERDNMQRLEEELKKYLATAKLVSCILFVDDGSTDGSTEMIRDICGRNPDMFYLCFEKNWATSTPTCRPLRRISISWPNTPTDTRW